MAIFKFDFSLQICLDFGLKVDFLWLFNFHKFKMRLFLTLRFGYFLAKEKYAWSP